MQQSHLGADALVRIESSHALEEIDLQLVEGGRVLLHGNSAELGEARLVVRQLQGVGPVVLIGRTEHLEYFENLIDLTVAGEQRSLLSHLGEDATRAPQVDAERVMLGRQENLGASVPQSHDLVRVSLDGQAEGSCETKISQLNRLAVVTDEKILRLEIAMEYTVRVKEDERLTNLIQERLSLLWRKCGLLLLHVFLEIVLEVFEDEVQLVLREEDLLEPIHDKQH